MASGIDAWLPVQPPTHGYFFGIDRSGKSAVFYGRLRRDPWHYRARVWIARHLLRVSVG